MRWAEIKTTVLIVLAGTLAKWADTIRRKIDRELRAAEDASESFPDDETRSDPPEHWARLIARRPPQHWLDLIRERAPHLLSKTDDELLSEEGVEIFERETAPIEDEVPLVEDDEVKGSQQETLRPQKRRDESRYHAEKKRRDSWLRRLRFHPPASLSESKPVYLQNSETTTTPEFASVAGHEPSAAADERRVSSQARSTGHSESEHTPTPKHRDAPPKKPAGFFRSLTRKVNHSDDAENRWTNSESAVSRNREQPTLVHPQAQRQSEPSHTYATNSTHARNEAVKVVQTEVEQRKSPSLRLLRSDHRKRPSSSRVQQKVDARTANVTPVSPLALRHGKSGRATADSSCSESPATKTERTRDVINIPTTERARNEFASPDFASSKYNAPLGESEEIWPALPVAPDWEPADEVAAMQREAERVRRLELEQRGALWNA